MVELAADFAERFEREQWDLDALCADRPLQTSELWPGNDYYGIATTLKRYADIPDDCSIKAVVPHGIYMNDKLVNDAERSARLSAALVYPAYRLRLYRDQARKIPVPSAAPFVYASRLIEPPALRSGTLFYPAHSLPGVTAEMDFDAIAEKLLDWPASMKPVSVSIYWHDYLLRHHRPFVERGIRVVSAGHMFDPDFLLRQAYLLKQHAHVASNAVGSHLFYATHAGCLFHLVEQPVAYSGSGRDIAANVVSPSGARVEVLQRIRRIFLSPVDRLGDEQRELVDYHLGAEFVLEPAEFRDLADWLDRLDRFGRIALWLDSGQRFGVDSPRPPAVPRRWLRAVSQLTHGAEKIVRVALSDAIRLTRSVFPFLRGVRVRRHSRHKE